MARFLAPEAFSAATEAISLLPFNFERTGTQQYLVANMVGDFIRLTEATADGPDFRHHALYLHPL